MSADHRVEKRFYPDGQVESEITYLEGRGNRWVTKLWHPNGVLASEVLVVDGAPEGIVRFWNQKGELVGTYEMHDGTGVQKDWHSDGSLKAEISWVNGQWTGRLRSYFEGGELAAETYWIQGKQVSKKKYFEAAAKDPGLPQYDDKRPSKTTVGLKQTTAVAAGPISSAEEALVGQLLAAPGTKEVLEQVSVLTIDTAEPSGSVNGLFLVSLLWKCSFPVLRAVCF